MQIEKMEVSLFFCLAVHFCLINMTLAERQPAVHVKAIPRSCLDHLRAGTTTNGYYSIAGPNGESIPIYCDFTSEPGTAWTMVLSWALKNNNLVAFQSTPFSVDAPVNERTPNWVAYRLSKAQMISIKAHSTHWRATCSFNTYGIDFTDYVRTNFKSLDVMTYLGDGLCKKVEYINIRGHAAYQKTARFWQVLNTYILVIDSYYSDDICQFGAKQGAATSEDNFGYYGTINKNFRCTAGPESTTQYWFGGYL
ncbi:uncharacterized protein LOC135689471 [Rhopilema esculentum]|uniref:uncharacterized protein LOC135689471 n=1 Tax=Rhopilema esculentum TaxID=499914 RepID=UPI0031D7B29B